MLLSAQPWKYPEQHDDTTDQMDLKVCLEVWVFKYCKLCCTGFLEFLKITWVFETWCRLLCGGCNLIMNPRIHWWQAHGCCITPGLLLPSSLFYTLLHDMADSTIFRISLCFIHQREAFFFSRPFLWQFRVHTSFAQDWKKKLLTKSGRGKVCRVRWFCLPSGLPIATPVQNSGPSWSHFDSPEWKTAPVQKEKPGVDFTEIN